MKGFGKFVLGGLLGAVFGFFVAPKHAQRVRDMLAGAVGATPVSLPERPAPPSLSTPIPSEPAIAEPVVAPEPALEPLPAASDGFAEPTSASRPSAASLWPVVEFEPKPAPETVAAPEPEFEAEAEPVVAPEPAPEPVAEPEPQPAPEPSAGFAELASEPAPEPVAEPESQPAPEPSVAFEAEAVEVAQEPLPTGTPELQADLMSKPEAWTAEDEPTLEQEEPAIAEAVAAEDHVAPPLDLKTRIEETRRRIQEELERPFAAAVSVDAEATAAVPVEAEAETTEESVAPAWVAPAWPSPPSADVVEVESPVDLIVDLPIEAAEERPLEPTEESPAEPVVPPPAGGEFDRDAMRRRIEATRNRLKAKAFDAMMSGESALLGRDDGAASDTGAKISDLQVDSEVDETIEKTLSEEDI